MSNVTLDRVSPAVCRNVSWSVPIAVASSGVKVCQV
jgi:hypothetical protein